VEESRVALIPKVIVPGALGPKEYGVLLTDRRMIFVLERASKAVLGVALGGAIGAAIAEGAASRRYVDYANEPPEALAADEKNIVVPYVSIRELRMKKSLGSYSMRVTYTTHEGKTKKLDSVPAAPADQIAQAKATGVKPKAAQREYVRKVQGALLQALPPVLAQKAVWGI